MAEITRLRTGVAAIVALLCAAQVGCNNQREDSVSSGAQANCVTKVSESHADLAFVACSLQGLYEASSVPVFVGIRNLHSGSQLVRAFLDVNGGLSVIVVDPNGNTLEPKEWWEPASITPETLPLRQYLMPRGGVMGRVVDLACDGMEYEGTPDCGELFDFSEPGVYVVQLRNEETRLCPDLCRLPSGPTDEQPVTFPIIELRIAVGRR
jgi:hypothetical protein